MTTSNIGNPLDTTTSSWLGYGSASTTAYPTKKEIIQRLFESKLISFEEMWVLLQNEENVRYVPMMPSYPQWPVSPWTPYYPPVVYTVPFVTYTGTGTSQTRSNGDNTT